MTKRAISRLLFLIYLYNNLILISAYFERGIFVKKIIINGIQVKIAKEKLTAETLTYAHKIAELYEIEQDRIMDYIIQKTKSII